MKNIRRNKLYATRYTLSAILVTLFCIILPQIALAASHNVAINEDTPVDIFLNSDITGNWTRTSNPAHGSITEKTPLTSVNSIESTYTPSKNYNGTDYFSYTVTDGVNSEVIEVNLTINPVDDSPALVVGNITFGVEDSTPVEKIYKLPTKEVDGDALTYVASNLPVGAALDPLTGELKWTVSTADIGTYGSYTFTVTDNTPAHLSDSKSVNIIIRQALTYYVDAANGDDANTGTSELPWKTLSRACTWYSGNGPKVTEGDVVLFRDGNYGQFKESTDDGAAYLFYRTDWVTYKADTGQTSVNLNSIIINNVDKWGSPRNDGRSYLKFEGFNITPTDATQNAVDLQYTSYIWIKGCNIANAAVAYTGNFAPYYWPGPACVAGVDVRHLTVEDSTISNAFRGISVATGYIESTDVIIRSNILHHFGEDGMVLIATNLLVEGNYEYDNNSLRVPITFLGTITGSFALGDVVEMVGDDGKPNATGIVNGVLTYPEDPSKHYLGIWQTSSQCFWSPIDQQNAAHKRGDTITGPNGRLTNIIYIDEAHCDGVTIESGSRNVVVTKNRIIRNLPGDEGEGSIIGAQALKLNAPTDIEVSNNLLVAGGTRGLIGSAILMGGGTTNFKLNNNTILSDLSVRNIGNPPLDIKQMYNNIIGSLSLDGDSGSVYPHVVNHGNNIFGNNPNGNGGPTYPFIVNGTELVNYDIKSLFVNSDNGDFRLKESSFAVGFADPAHAPATDILGISRDAQPNAGCYEYVLAGNFLYGDVSGDGEVSAYDAALTAQAAVELITLTPDQLKAAEVSGEGEVSAYDAALIAQKAVGLIDKFPVEQ